MMGARTDAADCREYAEVDPTGRYGRFTDVLGKGASKTVYRAFDEYQGMEVAWNQVKLHDFLQSPEDLERLYCEIHLLKTLKHRNIMKFYTSWVDVSRRNINFITEMFTSGTLRQYRQRHRRVNIWAVKHWCRQILSGLLYLHSHNPPIIHRDLKCDNIFVNGNQGEVKIGDLGLAAILRKSHAVHCVGTPEFMAPEVYEEEYNELVDIYSFGMCVLEMVTFEYPYSECTHPVQIYKKVISGTKPEALYKVKDPMVRRFVEKCLASASQRLSARELLEDPFLRVDDMAFSSEDGDYNVTTRYIRQPSNLGHTYSNGSMMSNGFSDSIDEDALTEDRWDCEDDDMKGQDGIDLFNEHEDEPLGNVDITIKGRKSEDGGIFLRLRISDSDGRVRNIYFPFDVEADTALSVATEMVAELDITDHEVTRIADMIDGRTAPRRRKRPHNPMHYYADSSSVYKGNSTYYPSGPLPQWQSDTGAAASMSTFGPPGGGWHTPPPDMTSGVYSNPHGPPLPPPSPHEALGLGKGTFTYEQLAAATGNFSPANLIGQGGFGYVHKGVLPGGRAVAVKQLKSGSGQGEREFQAEVDIISRVHHRHLVFLVGYCIAGARRVLVYEFVPNKTLEFHLHGKGQPVMEWPTRLRIALGSAKGLAYLHEDCHPRIIHRDIKSANILLDNNFEAMVADFGLAKLSSDNNTHVSTRVMGTFGYLAPEYASSGKLTEKSDVFSYGVMLLELLTGRRPVDTGGTATSFLEDSLVDWARPALSRALADGDYDGVADPRLHGNYDPVEMARLVASAVAAVRHSAKKRPKMSQIVRALEGDMSLEDLSEGVRPGQSMTFATAAPAVASYNANRAPGQYTADMERIRQAPMAIPEYSGAVTVFGRPLPIGSEGSFDDDDLSPVKGQSRR